MREMSEMGLYYFIGVLLGTLGGLGVGLSGYHWAIKLLAVLFLIFAGYRGGRKLDNAN